MGSGSKGIDECYSNILPQINVWIINLSKAERQESYFRASWTTAIT